MDRSVFRHDPLICRISAARVDIVGFQFRIAVVAVSAVCFVIRQHREVFAVPVSRAVVPAVASLSLREVILQNGVVCSVRIRFGFGFRFWLTVRISDLNGQSAAVIAVVAFRIDREDQHVAGLHFKCFIDCDLLV